VSACSKAGAEEKAASSRVVPQEFSETLSQQQGELAAGLFYFKR
jgi:hypothetical protein